MVHEVRRGESEEKPHDAKKPRGEANMPLDAVRGRSRTRFDGDRRDSSSDSRDSSSDSRDSSSDGRYYHLDRQYYSSNSRNYPRDSRYYARSSSVSSIDSRDGSERYDSLIRNKKSIVPEEMFSSRDKAGDGKKTEKSFARSAWDKVRKLATSQNTMMGVMFADGAIDNISQKFSNVEGELLHAGGGGGKEGGGMPPILPNSDSGKEEEGDKTPEKKTKGTGREASVPESAMEPRTEGRLKEPKGGVAEEVVKGARVTFHEHSLREAERSSRESVHSSSLHEESLMAGGLND